MNAANSKKPKKVIPLPTPATPTMVKTILGRVMMERYSHIKSNSGHYYLIDGELQNSGLFMGMGGQRQWVQGATRMKDGEGRVVTQKDVADGIVAGANALWLERLRSYMMQVMMLP